MLETGSRSGWRNQRFDQLATIVNDRVDDPADAGVDRYVGLEHLDSESLTIRRWGSPDDVGATKLRFRVGDIIFGRRRAYQRKLAVADFDGICSAHAMVLRAKPEGIRPDFLPLFMQSDAFMERAQEISVGSLSPTINWNALAKEEFALPPRKAQLQIVELLHSANALTDSLTALQNAAERVLASAASSEFAALRSRSISMVLLESVCSQKPQSGIYKSEEFRGKGTAMVSMGELFGGDLIGGSLDIGRITLDSAELARYRLTARDLLFGRRSIVLEGAGRCVLVGDMTEPVVFESSVLRVTVDPALADSRFVFEWLRSPYGHQQIRRIVTFTTVSGVKGSDVARLPVPLPSLADQTDIADRLSSLRRQVAIPRGRVTAARRLAAGFTATMLGGRS